MADAKKLEREYIIPLRKEWLKTPKHKRAKKAVRAIRLFLSKHMKVEFEDVKIGRFLNEYLWARGIKNPPAKVKVKVIREEGIARAELLDLSEKQKKMLEEEKKTEETKKKEKEEQEKAAKAKEEAEKKAEKEEKKKETEEEKEEKEKKKEMLKEDIKEIKKEVNEEKIKEKMRPKEMPQSQAQHTMKRQHSE